MKRVFVMLASILISVAILSGCAIPVEPASSPNLSPSPSANSEPDAGAILPGGGSTGGKGTQPGTDGEDDKEQQKTEGEKPEEEQKVEIDKDVRFLKWYILLSDSASATVQGVIQSDASFVFLLSNPYGSPTADGHYEGKSCHTFEVDYSTLKVDVGGASGYSFWTGNAQDVSIELVQDPLNPGKLTADFSVNYNGSNEWNATGYAPGTSQNSAGTKAFASNEPIKMKVDLFSGTQKGGNKVTLYWSTSEFPEYNAIPLYGYLFSSDELDQSEFDDYVKQLDERIENEKNSKTEKDQQMVSTKAQLEAARESARQFDEWATKAAEEGDKDAAMHYSNNAEAERRRIERLEGELTKLGQGK